MKPVKWPFTTHRYSFTTFRCLKLSLILAAALDVFAKTSTPEHGRSIRWTRPYGNERCELVIFLISSYVNLDTIYRLLRQGYLEMLLPAFYLAGQEIPWQHPANYLRHLSPPGRVYYLV